MCEEETDWGQGRFYGQDVDRCGRETVGNLALNLVPEYIHLLDHRAIRDKEIGPVGQHWQQEGLGQAVGPEQGEPRLRRGEPFNDRQGGVCQG